MQHLSAIAPWQIQKSKFIYELIYAKSLALSVTIVQHQPQLQYQPPFQHKPMNSLDLTKSWNLQYKEEILQLTPYMVGPLEMLSSVTKV